MSRILATMALAGILAGAVLVIHHVDPVRVRADSGKRWGAWDAESWHRLQRTYPTGRVPPEGAVARAFDAVRERPEAPGRTRPVRPHLSLPGEDWVSIGPQPIFTQNRPFAGRVTALAPHPTLATTVFLGTDSGGVWRTTDGGVSWTSLTDAIPVPAIQSLAIDPIDPSLVYATTIHRTYGTRWLRSTDGGNTWSVSSITTTAGATLSPRLCSVNAFKACIPPSSGRILIDPRAAGSPETSRLYYVGLSHLLQSNDSGRTFQSVLSLDIDFDFGDPNAPNDRPESEFIRDAGIDPARPDRLFVTVVQPSCATPDCARTSGTVVVYRSLNRGGSWSRQAVAGLAEFAPGAGTRYADPGAIYVPRLRVAVAPSNPDRVAIAIRDEVENRVRLVRSLDAGETWTLLPGPANSVTWPVALAFAPADADTIFVGSSGNYRSTDNGDTWTTLQSTHADNVVMAFDADGRLLVGNDGGLFRSTAGTAFESLHLRLPVTEFYSIATHPTNPLIMAGGTQDNGTVIFQGSLGWSLLTGGDGGDTVWDPTPGTTRLYAEVEWLHFNGQQVFQFYRCEPGGCVQRSTGIDLGDDGPFIPRILMDPVTPATLWLAVERMYRTDNRAETWTPASPSVANLERCWNDPTAGRQCARARYFTAAAIAATAPQTVYAGTLNGDVRVTNNRGGSWRSLAGTEAGPLPVRPVNDVVVDPLDSNTVYVAYSGFDSGGSGTGHVFRTTNGGVTWTDISGTLPDLPVNVLLIDPDSATPGTARVLYAGTDIGVLRATVGSTTGWSAFGTGLPPVVVNDLAYNAATRQLIAATYGRGAYAISSRFAR